jgi:enoyl-CoA hydratase/carnithine racemase
MTDPRVGVEVSDRVAYVTINRPEAKNALTKSMYAAIRDACNEADCNSDIDVLVLRGSNGAFAVGGDLKEILDILEGDEPTAILNYEEFLPFEAVRSMKKPTVAHIDGLCIGGGLTLALMCDILIASNRSRFAIPEAKVGIVDGHLPGLLRDALPPARLRYWMYTGAIFPAGEAYEVGLVTQVVPPEELDGAVDKCLKELKASSQTAIRACKRVLNQTRQLSPMTDAYLSMLQPAALQRLQQFRAR